ncbi:hypothetical protein JXR93_13385 [bacterium]|nr:hypothetical protein [bacterium]
MKNEHPLWIQRLSRFFGVGVVFYMVLRFVIAIPTLGPYGVNPYIFGLLDVITAIPFAVGVPRLILFAKQRENRKIIQWIIVLAISFIIPYLYIAIEGEKIPKLIWGALSVVILGLGIEAFLSVRSKIRAAIREEDELITKSYEDALISEKKNIFIK